MNFLSVTETTLAFCGRQYVHLYSTLYERSTTSVQSEYSGSDRLISLDLHKYLPPPPAKTDHSRVSAICCNLTEDAHSLCVADSEKNIYVFRKQFQVWDYYASFALDRRALKVKFDKKGENLLIVDKCGNVLVACMDSPETVSNPIPLKGISALTLDTLLSQNNRQLLTCDGSVKMFVTKFPDAYDIKAYSFGRNEMIATMVLINGDQHLLVFSASGLLRVWNMSDHRCLKTFNLFQTIHGVKFVEKEENEVKGARVAQAFGHTYIAIRVFGYNIIPVFELDFKFNEVRQLGQVSKDSEFCDLGWHENTLFTYNPEIPVVIKRFTVTSNGVICDANFQIPQLAALGIDFRGFVAFMNHTINLQKHFSSDLLRLSQGQKVMDEYVAAAEKRIPRLARGGRAIEAEAKPRGWVHPELLSNKIPSRAENLDTDTEEANADIEFPGTSDEASRIQGGNKAKFNAYRAALNNYPLLVEVEPVDDDTGVPRPVTSGSSRVLLNLLKKSKSREASRVTTAVSEVESSTIEEIIPSSFSGRTKARARVSAAKSSRPYSYPADPTKSDYDPEITQIAKSTSLRFLDTLKTHQRRPVSEPQLESLNPIPIPQLSVQEVFAPNYK